MATDIQTLIEERPHLKNPLELYARWQHFQHEANKLLPKAGSAFPGNSQPYPRENMGAALHLFASIFDVPEAELASLAREMEAGDIDFMRLPLDELPALPLSFADDELATILFLFSRPYFQELRRMSPQEKLRQWEDGRCPLCSARPALASITEGPQRLLHCSWCGSVGTYRFRGCPNCGTGDTGKLSTFVPEEEPGFRITACDACRTYVKIVDSSILDRMTADQADLASLPLDIVAQEKGYDRWTPNPIGLKKMG